MQSLSPMVFNLGFSSVAYFHLVSEFQAQRVATNVMKAKNVPKTFTFLVCWSLTLDKIQCRPEVSTRQRLPSTPFGGEGFLNTLEETCWTMFQLRDGPQTWRLMITLLSKALVFSTLIFTLISPLNLIGISKENIV